PAVGCPLQAECAAPEIDGRRRLDQTHIGHSRETEAPRALPLRGQAVSGTDRFSNTMGCTMRQPRPHDDTIATASQPSRPSSFRLSTSRFGLVTSNIRYSQRSGMSVLLPPRASVAPRPHHRPEPNIPIHVQPCNTPVTAICAAVAVVLWCGERHTGT